MPGNPCDHVFLITMASSRVDHFFGAYAVSVGSFVVMYMLFQENVATIPRLKGKNERRWISTLLDK